MSWLSSRSTQSAAAYRYTNFVGARILQDTELNGMQTVQAAKDKMAADALFREGATTNVAVAVSGTTVTLSALDSSIPLMMVLVNGAFEPIQPGTYTLPGVKTSGTDTLYLHWVLWRVTKDGTYQGSSGCLADASLTDSVTGEPIGERGQLQLLMSFDQTLSSEAIDSVRMIAKSSAGIPVFLFTWTANVAAYTPQDNINSYLVGSLTQSGAVKVSTPTAAGVAAGNDDSRLSDTRTPTDGTVTTSKIKTVELDPAGGTTSISTSPVLTGSTNGGVSLDQTFWGAVRCKGSEIVNWLYTQVTGLASSLVGHEVRITALENKPEQVIDLSYHIGKPLGKSTDGGWTHEPVVHDISDGYRHYGNGDPNYDPSSFNNLYGYAVYAKDGTTVMGAITHAGDFVLLNPYIRAHINAMAGGADICSLYKLANFVAAHYSAGGGSGGGGVILPGTDHLSVSGDVEGDTTASTVVKIQNTPVDLHRSDGTDPVNGDAIVFQNGNLKMAPVGGGSGATLSGDVQGAANATTVAKIGGKTVDISAIASGQFLGFDGSKLTGLTPPGTPVLNTPTAPIQVQSPNTIGASISYTILTLGGIKIAFGSGLLPHGAKVPFPAGWNLSWTSVSAAVAQTPRAYSSLAIDQPSLANAWTVGFTVDGDAPSDAGSWLAAVSVMTLMTV